MTLKLSKKIQSTTALPAATWAPGTTMSSQIGNIRFSFFLTYASFFISIQQQIYDTCYPFFNMQDAGHV
jgi:hypothetical protein